jgi:hypothetical protein
MFDNLMLHYPACHARMPGMSTNYVRQGRGKVARLPVEARNLVNQGMRDGKAQVEIMAELEAMGFAGVTRSNLSRWRKGGYARWLEAQESFERAHALSAESEALLGQLQPGGRSERADLGEAVLASQLAELLESFPAEERQGRTEEYLRVARAFSGFMQARAQLQWVELERTRQQVELRKTRPKRKGRGMTAEEVADFKERIRLI